MDDAAIDQLMNQLSQLPPSADSYATQVVDALLDGALRLGASDVHVEKCSRALKLRLRVAGKLIDLGEIDDGKSTQVLSRIKAIARLVSYRSDIPQEGRFQFTTPDQGQESPLGRAKEARVGTLPLIDGERAVIRLSVDEKILRLPDQLGLPAVALERLLSAIGQSSGVVLITGAAGSGKTTTAYAIMRYLASKVSGTRSLVSLEDPVEVVVTGVSQSQINPANGYDWEAGLKTILRQDPEVLMIGEIRDASTARLVFQAAMTGQLVISTMHARSAADSLRRLLDMQVPVHHLLSSLEFLVCQKLRLGEPLLQDIESRVADNSSLAPMARQLTCELLPQLESELAQTLLADDGGREIEFAARRQGMRTFAEQWQPKN